MKISVIGGGYVGLVTGVCLAGLGHTVHIINRDPAKAAAINSGMPPIYEPGLDRLLKETIGRTLSAGTGYTPTRDSDLIFICVGTPALADGRADLSMVSAASRSIGEALAGHPGRNQVVVVKSTVPPGTTDSLVRPTVEEGAGRAGIGFAMNPEFLREGRAIEDFFHPDRIVIGSDIPASCDLVATAYHGVDAPVFRTSIPAAEMIKYASNAFLATKISFANEIGNLCKRLGIDTYQVMEGVGMDHRISPHFLNAGAGFGGSCFPKDVAALIQLSCQSGEDPRLLRSVMEVNENQPLRLLPLLEKRIGNLAGKRVAILGLAFKDNTDDIRDSRSTPVIRALLGRGALVTAYDPLAVPAMRQVLPEVSYFTTPGEALEGADACLIMTEWPEFSNLSAEFDRMHTKIIIEGRRILRCGFSEGICW